MTTAVAAWFAVAFFLLPGFLVAWVSGLRAPAAVAAALPVTFGIAGLGAWMWGWTSAPFNLWTGAVSLVVALLAAAAWRFAFVRKARRGGQVSWRRALFPGGLARGGVADPYWLLPAAGVVAGAYLLISDRLAWLVRLPNGTYNIVQGWDVQWHANLVRFIMDTGVASPTRMGELQHVETQTQLLYPSAYHAGIALFGQAAGLDPLPALNIASTVLPGIAFPLTMACLAFAFLRSTELTAQIAAGLAAILVYALPQVVWIPEYVGMWPYLFGMAMTGIVIWQFLSVPGRRAGAFATALGFLGLLQVHPSPVTVVVVAVVLFWLTSTLIRPERTRISDTLWLALPALAGGVLFLPQALAGSTQAGEVASWQPEEDLGVDGAWGKAFFMDTRHVDEFFPAFDPTVWLWLAAAGAVVCAVWRFQVWPVLFYAVSLLATMNALDPFGNGLGEALSVIGNLHYSTGHRLVMPVAMAVAAGAAIAVAAAIRLVALAPAAKRYGKGVRASVAASVALAVAAGAVAVPVARAQAREGAQAAYESPRNNDRMVDADDLAAFRWLASQPAAYEGLTIGDPADGYSWLYATTGVPTVARHYLWPAGGRGSDFEKLFWQADALGEGKRNIVDQAAEDLNVKFFFLSPGSFWSYQISRYELLRALWASDGVTPVFHKGDTVVFAVNAAFSQDELEDMQRDAVEHGSDELYELTPAAAVRGGASSL